MRKTYSRTEIAVGIPISLLLLGGFSTLAWYAIAYGIPEPQPHARIAVIVFSLMMAIMGLAGLLRFAACRWRWLGTLASLTWCASMSVFGLSFILIGIFERGSISGGIPLLPTSFNQALGSLAFIAAGLVVLAFMPALFRHQQEFG